jgi:hypothetical protein
MPVPGLPGGLTRVGVERDLRFLRVLAHDQIAVRLPERGLDRGHLVAGDDDEVRGVGADALVLFDRERDDLGAGLVAAFAEEADHLVAFFGPYLADAFVDDTEQGFVARDPRFATVYHSVSVPVWTLLNQDGHGSRIHPSIPRQLGIGFVTLPENQGGRKVLEVSKQVEALAEQMLADAYELVLGGWCQGSGAQDEMGRAIEPSSAFARRWSAAGALERVWRRSSENGDLALEAFERANLALAGAIKDAPQRWNDHEGRSCAEVLAAFEDARRLLYLPAETPLSLVEDLLDDLDGYERIPGYLFESST